MVKRKPQISTELNLLRQKKRCTIQLLSQKFPNLTNVQIAKIVGVTSMTVSNWKNKKYFSDAKRKRKSKLTKKIKNFLLRNAKNKFSGVNKASSRRLSLKLKKTFNIDISFQQVNVWLRKILRKPIRAKKTFLLKNKDKKKRIEFGEMIIKKNIKGKNIFFTDEKRFILTPLLNNQTNQIRLDNKGYNEYKSGKGKLFEKISRPIPKFQNGIMVAAGLSYNGPGKLIFVTGTMNSFSYEQTLQFYKEDIERLGSNLFFQQDNAPCHVGKKSTNFIKSQFKNYLDFWPPNSPDLSPIEELWAIVLEKLNQYTFKTVEDLTRKLQWVWNRIPKSICRNLIDSFDEKIQLVINDGERTNRREKNYNNKKHYSWKNNWNSTDFVERIVYNEKILENMKEKKLKALNKELLDIQNDLKEEKKRYCRKNKVIIKKDSEDLYSFFLSQEKEMLKIYTEKIENKKKEIQNMESFKGKELFNLFSNEEKINNIRIVNSKNASNLSTKQNSFNSV